MVMTSPDLTLTVTKGSSGPSAVVFVSALVDATEYSVGRLRAFTEGRRAWSRRARL